MRFRMHVQFVVAAVVCLLTTGAFAQPLVEHAPADAFVYFGWSGIGKSKGLEGSHLQAVMKSANISQRMSDSMVQLGQLAGKQDPQARQVFDVLSKLGAATWNYPFVLYVVPPAAGGKPNAQPNVVVKWQAGENSPALMEQLKPLMEQAAQEETMNPPKVAQAGGFVVVYVGAMTEAQALAAKPAASLGESARFKQAAAKLVKSPSAVAYLDGEAMLAAINRATEKDPTAKDWPKTRDALGLTGLKGVIWSGGFDGKEWASSLFVDAPAPRKGLLTALDCPPLSNDILKLAPKDAVWVTVTRLDLGSVIDQLRAGVGAIDPAGVEAFNRSIAQANALTGEDIELILRGFGPEWLLYTDPLTSGAGGFGVVIVNPLRDAAKVEAGLASIEQFANRMATMQRKPGEPAFNSSVFEQEGVKVHTINALIVAPSWAVVDKNLYFSMSPQAVLEAAVYRKKQPGSILDNERYIALRKRLDVKAPGGVTFVDLQQTAVSSYQAILMLTQLFGGALQMQGMGNPLASPLPPLSAILPHLAPSGSVSWSDAAGYYYKGITPFPGADLLAPQGSQLSASQSAIAVGVLLPALGAARRTANQMKSSANLRGIHQSMVIFANSNKDVYPDGAGKLLEGQFIGKDMLVSSLTPELTVFPADFDKLPTAQKNAWVAEHGGYTILVWGKPVKVDSKLVVGYLKPSHSDGKGINVVFGDNHAEWVMPMDRAIELIKQQYPDHQIEGVDAAGN